MSSSISTSEKQDLKLENTAEILEEEKPIITPKQEAPQEVVSEYTIPPCPNSDEATPNVEKDTIQAGSSKDDEKKFICMKCKKEFTTSDMPDGDQTTQENDPVVESNQNLFKQTILINSSEGGSSSSNSAFASSFNGGSSSNSGFPLFSGGITEMTTTMFSPPIPYSSILWYDRVPIDSYQGLSFGYNYGGGSSCTNSYPLFGNGFPRGVSSMLPPPTPNPFFSERSAFRIYKPEPIHYSSYGLPNDVSRVNPFFGSSDKSIGGSNNDNRVDPSVSGEVPREVIDLNKPPCSLVDPNLELEVVDKGQAKMDIEGDVKDMVMGMKSWGTKKRRTK